MGRTYLTISAHDDKVALGYIDRTAINNTVLKVYLYQIIKL